MSLNVDKRKSEVIKLKNDNVASLYFFNTNIPYRQSIVCLLKEKTKTKVGCSFQIKQTVARIIAVWSFDMEAVLKIVLVLLAIELAQASHFRGGTVSWKPSGRGNEVNLRYVPIPLLVNRVKKSINEHR